MLCFYRDFMGSRGAFPSNLTAMLSNPGNYQKLPSPYTERSTRVFRHHILDIYDDKSRSWTPALQALWCSAHYSTHQNASFQAQDVNTIMASIIFPFRTSACSPESISSLSFALATT